MIFSVYLSGCSAVVDWTSPPRMGRRGAVDHVRTHAGGPLIDDFTSLAHHPGIMPSHSVLRQPLIVSSWVGAAPARQGARVVHLSLRFIWAQAWRGGWWGVLRGRRLERVAAFVGGLLSLASPVAWRVYYLPPLPRKRRSAPRPPRGRSEYGALGPQSWVARPAAPAPVVDSRALSSNAPRYCRVRGHHRLGLDAETCKPSSRATLSTVNEREFSVWRGARTSMTRPARGP
jgi:hypothetical protein